MASTMVPRTCRSIFAKVRKVTLFAIFASRKLPGVQAGAVCSIRQLAGTSAAQVSRAHVRIIDEIRTFP